MANKSNKHYLSTMEEHSIQITKTGRYFSLGSLSKKTTSVWIVCHGYGQLANYFLRNFNVLEDENTYIVAPEGFHRYYLNGFSGRVGASWMTKEDRLSDIDDYVNYLDRVYKSIFSKIDRKNATVNVLGFSQGGATTTSWACQGKSI
ncbi:MAG: hypothetical protein JKY53_14090, partial [Flavobacteriales bacterium]|nr:hypothetical protein [Flavobacteriales bacterium]